MICVPSTRIYGQKILEQFKMIIKCGKETRLGKNKGYREMDILAGTWTGKMSEGGNGTFHGSDK